MENYEVDDNMNSMESDLTLISNIKDNNDEDSLLTLIDRHSGIFHTMVNYFMCHPTHSLDKNEIVREKEVVIYDSAINFDPSKNTKFSTHLANQTKWKCLNALNKKAKTKEFSINDENSYIEPHCDSFMQYIDKEEAMLVFEKCFNEEEDERAKKIIDMRYGTANNKVTPWRNIAKKLDLSIQGCINIHNKFINKIKKEGKYV